MKCSQCAAENDADSRYCKKCGSELGPKATETNSAGKAKRGGFYRFCLGTTAIWTCFLLGSFLATGMTMVNHGISDPAVFGLGFGMGLIFFAGVWFIGVVVLLLLALATRPSPSVQWPRATKVATACIAVIVFIWPIVNASRLPAPSGHISASSNPLAIAPNGVGAEAQWQIREDKSAMDGTKTVVISRDAENDIQGWLESNRPSLIVRCQERKTEAYIVTGTAANVEYDTDSHTVRLRFDDGKPITQHWSASTDDKALFAPNAIEFAKNLVGSKLLTFEFTPFNANPAVVHFRLEGLAPYLQKAAAACGWQMPRVTE
jgi:type VI secretion system protein VasI